MAEGGCVQRWTTYSIASQGFLLTSRFYRNRWEGQIATVLSFGASLHCCSTLLGINSIEVEVSLKCARRSDCYNAQY
jgi:hypothetical protein